MPIVDGVSTVWFMECGSSDYQGIPISKSILLVQEEHKVEHHKLLYLTEDIVKICLIALLFRSRKSLNAITSCDKWDQELRIFFSICSRTQVLLVQCGSVPFHPIPSALVAPGVIRTHQVESSHVLVWFCGIKCSFTIHTTSKVIRGRKWQSRSVFCT